MRKAGRMPTDIISEIDQLIDSQIDAGEAVRKNQYPKCHHCGDDWHGLPITQRMREMRLNGVFDESYRFADDDSAVLCPGSDFIGPVLRQSVRDARDWSIYFGGDQYPVFTTCVGGSAGIYQARLSLITTRDDWIQVTGGNE